jgi:UDP-N-acetylglucosamine--N-acetylmuramyl-(pentapeptide) pyrophosphoryl-undecaprenol N-acetylglucosamine transferase
VTGVPVRPEFFAAGELPPSPPLSLLVVGGSQGARQLNDLVPRALARLALDGELAVVHQAGAANVDAARAAYAAAALPPRIRVEVAAFLDDMPGALAAAHLVISRAGAITLAEICAAGRPALLVPLGLAGGHQVDNARRLAGAGAAESFPPGAGDDDFGALLAALLGDRRRLEAMARAARGLARPDAAEAIAERVVHLGEGR